MNMSRALQSGAIALTLLTLAACADYVQLKPDAEAVNVTYLGNTANCVGHGTVHVSVLNKIGPIGRSELTVENELANLARNAALGAGGDTIAPAGPVVDGGRDFNIYRCRK